MRVLGLGLLGVVDGMNGYECGDDDDGDGDGDG